ncbi:hypothetical protein [Saccharothrix syringae]|uniref:hypothetical protein n=1 Tax=Saccharothrix syringae TaxID=103733 RepID=UPI002241058C|nr:hypothetical protein [Saccharothrix syringae]
MLLLLGPPGGLGVDVAATVLPVLRAVLVAAAKVDAVVVTTGADAGLGHLVGLAAESLEGRWPRLVGVAPSGRVAAEEAEPAGDEVRLNANHDTAVLVPGSGWGEEVPALFRVVDAVVAGKRPALAVLVGGGGVARGALVDHLSRDRPLLVLAGTGGLADEIAHGDFPDGGASNAEASNAEASNAEASNAEASGAEASGAEASGAEAGGDGTGSAGASGDGASSSGRAISGMSNVDIGSSRAVPADAAAVMPPAEEVTGGMSNVDIGPDRVSAAGGDDLAILLRSGQVAVVHVDEGPDKVVAVLRRVLAARPGAEVHVTAPPPTAWPRLRFRPPEPHPVVDPGYVLDYPLLADAIHEANQLVAPALHECEVAALRARERARLRVVLAIGAGFATTVFAALQVWLRDVAWPGVLVAAAGAVAAVLTVVARNGEDPDAGLRAERLRALYFDHLAAPPAEGDAGREERARELAAAVARYRHEPVSRV